MARMKPRDQDGFHGLDISSFQTITNPAKFFANSPHYNYFRAYGSNHSDGGDTSFVHFVSLAKQYGVPSGAYHFGTPRKPLAGNTVQSEAYAEADLFIAKLQTGYGQSQYGELVPILDIEEYRDLRSGTDGYPKASGMTAQELTDWILAFRDRFYTQTGRAIMFYSNRYFMQDSTQMALSNTQMQQLAFMPLWLAEYDRWYPSNPTQGPDIWAGWDNYNLWQYEVLENADYYGVTSAGNEIDHDYTDDLALIMPPPQPTNIQITQISDTEIKVSFTEPNVSDYISSDIYLDGIWNTTLTKGTNSKEITVSTPIGSLLQINVVAQDKWQDKTWSQNTYHTMSSVGGDVPPEIPSDQTYDYTSEEIRDMLHAKKGSRNIRFRYNLLTKDDERIRKLKNVLDGKVSMNAFNTIKRTATFQIRDEDDEPIDYLNDRIQPFVELKMPDKWVQSSNGGRKLVRGKWISYSLGIYILSSPIKKEKGDFVYRDVEAYDKGIILEEDKITDRISIAKGTNYIEAAITVLKSAGITKYNFEATDKIIISDMEYEPGTPKSKIIAEMLNAINYHPLWVDGYGYFTSSVYVSPTNREADYSYENDEFSVLAVGMEEELDLYSIPNYWSIYYSNVDSVDDVGAEVTLISNYENQNPESPTSVINRGRSIVDFRRIEDIADQESLDDYVKRIAFNSSQVYGKIKFQTIIMPFHGFQDVLFLQNETLDINDKYSETSWTIHLKAGALMTHEARRITNI